MPNLSQKILMPSFDEALPGRSEVMAVNNQHFVHGKPIQPPFTDDENQLAKIAFGLGCFWGAERLFWQKEGVYTTAVGYGAGYTSNPTYEEVCSGLTGHNELVLVVYRPTEISFQQLLSTFFEAHNPTQGMRQGNDVGTQYRSGIYFFENEFKETQLSLAQQTRTSYQQKLEASNFGNITTEIEVIEDFYYAEEYHQQYLAKNPNGYCGIGGTGISCNVSS